MLIFVPIPLFLTPQSPFIMVSNIPNYQLPQNWALGAPKWVPKPPKRGKMTIFPKLKGLECSFLFLSHHFPPHRVHLWYRVWSLYRQNPNIDTHQFLWNHNTYQNFMFMYFNVMVDRCNLWTIHFPYRIWQRGCRRYWSCSRNFVIY